jgi:hypothetical protein
MGYHIVAMTCSYNMVPHEKVNCAPNSQDRNQLFSAGQVQATLMGGMGGILMYSVFHRLHSYNTAITAMYQVAAQGEGGRKGDSANRGVETRLNVGKRKKTMVQVTSIYREDNKKRAGKGQAYSGK